MPWFAWACLFDPFPVVGHSTSTVVHRNEKPVSDPGCARALIISLKDLALEWSGRGGGLDVGGT